MAAIGEIANSRLVKLLVATWLFGIGAVMPNECKAEVSVETFYYWVVPFDSLPNIPHESFVIAVSGSQVASIETIRAAGGIPGFVGKIASGSVSYNKDYYAPGQPVWNWHVNSVDKIFDFKTTFFAECACPYFVATPSEIAANPAAWIRKNGNHYTPLKFHIGNLVFPNNRGGTANVSNRGLAGAGERTLITGFIVSGGEPRNFVLRALGPSLTSAGIQQPVTNPKFDLYDASGTKVASNGDWKADARAQTLATSYPTLTPKNDKEAAMFTTLLPGTYTLHGQNEDASEGVMLIEAYDLGANR